MIGTGLGAFNSSVISLNATDDNGIKSISVNGHVVASAAKTEYTTKFYLSEYLDENGYTDTENHCNEWNYVRGWTEDFVYSIKSIIGIKGATFTLYNSYIKGNTAATTGGGMYIREGASAEIYKTDLIEYQKKNG